MNDVIVKDEIKIENMIYEVRGKQVMLDSDLAKLYGCKNGTKDINKSVKRNLDRFPEDFYFELNEDQLKQGQYSKYKSHVFTEQGIAILATVLRTENASKVSIKIMRTFVEMRRFINAIVTN